MTLKLAKLPNRTPVKISVTFTPDIHDALTDYATLYEKSYGAKEKIEDIIPYIVSAYLATDNGFKRARKELKASNDYNIHSPIESISKRSK